MSEQGEGSTVAKGKDDPNVYLRAKVKEVRFNGVYEACRALQVIAAPHWPADNDGYMQSKKAAVYQIKKGKTHTATIKLAVDCKGMTSTGKLTGTLGKLIFEGEASLTNSTKEITVTVTLKETPASLHWAKGKMIWEMNAGAHAALAGHTQVELFFVFDDPAKRKFFSEDGVWIEALRFIFKEAKLEGAQKIKDALRKVTECCFRLPQHKYEIEEGAPNFGGYSGFFRLEKYMQPKKEAVNCYDQAYAVIVFSGALGIPVDGLYIEPYGFLKLTQLVGWGNCNNPFPGRKYKFELRNLAKAKTGGLKLPIKEEYLVVDARDESRQPFGNHMFCAHSGNVYDACAGPAVGKHDPGGYLLNAVDTVIPVGMERYVPASAEAIAQNTKRNLTDMQKIPRDIGGKTYQLNTQVKAVYDEAKYQGARNANKGKEPFLTTHTVVDSVQ